jgi:tetratricopeptide (TPR) repeat protein
MKRSLLYTIYIGLLLSFCIVNSTVYAASRYLPSAVRAVLVKTNSMLQEKDYPRAIETLLAFQSKGGSFSETGRPDPKGYHHPEIYYYLGNCYLFQEQYQAAITAYGHSVTGDPNHTYAWLNLAKAHYETANYTEAGRCFGQGYDTGSQKKPEHLYFSAAAHLMAGDHHRSIRLFERLMAAHPAAMTPEWKESFVHALMAADMQRRALPYIRELADVFAGDKQIQWQEILLYQYVKLDMRVEALRYARELARRTPTVAKWWKALAHIQLNDSRYEEALGALTIYSFLNPLTMDEKQLLADLNLQLGIPVKAAPIYQTCLQEKSDKKILQHLVLAYRQLGRTDAALELVDAFQIDPGDADLMLLKGELHYQLKQFRQAAAAYRKAARTKGKHAGRAWLMAGYAAWQTDDIAASKQAFARAEAHTRQKKAARAALRQLARVSIQHPRRGKGSIHDGGLRSGI